MPLFTNTTLLEKETRSGVERLEKAVISAHVAAKMESRQIDIGQIQACYYSIQKGL